MSLSQRRFIWIFDHLLDDQLTFFLSTGLIIKATLLMLKKRVRGDWNNASENDALEVLPKQPSICTLYILVNFIVYSLLAAYLFCILICLTLGVSDFGHTNLQL